MSDFDFLMLFAKVSGFRLIVLANRLGCETDFQRQMHDEVAAILADQAAAMQGLMRRGQDLAQLDRNASPEVSDDWLEFALYDDEVKFFLSETRFELMDSLEIDYDTMEYRVNGEPWGNAYSADCDGNEICYPRTEAVGRDELGSLKDILSDIGEETGLPISVTRVIYD